MAKLTQSEVEAYLGRSLTSLEKTNFNNNYDTAQEILESILCISLDTHGSGQNSGQVASRIFDARDGYSTVFTGIFRSLQSVKVNGETVTDYTAKFWDNRNTTSYNSIVFDKPLRHNDTVEVEARWGFHKLPNDLGWLLASVMDSISKQNKLDRTVAQKEVEDFSIQYNVSTIAFKDTIISNLKRDFEDTITKYGMCHIGEFRSGRVC